MQARKKMRRGGYLLLTLAGSLLPTAGFSFDFRAERLGLQGIVDFEVAYGIRMRMEDRDEDLIAVASGGKNAQNANLDDGDLNYDKGKPTSNMVQATGELTLTWRHVGLFARGLAFYDFENELHDRERTDLKSAAKEQVGKDARLLDHYLYTRFDVGEIPVQLRLGDQVVNWGESSFFPATGVNIINPFDLGSTQRPTSTLRDLRKPVGMLWGTASITELFAIEGYYQYDWDATTLPAIGTFLGTNDSIVPGATFAQFTGTASDLGTDRCQAFNLPPQAFPDNQCFDFGFLKTPRINSDRPSDQGQWGLTLQTIVPQLNDTKLALHYANYHSKNPMISAFAGSAETAAILAPAAIGRRAAELAPFYLQQGLDPREATSAAVEAATTLALGEATQDLLWFLEYPEDIHMVGFSFNTTSIATGTAYSGEIAHHMDVPLLIHPGEFLSAVLPVPQPPDAPNADNPLPYSPRQRVKAWTRRDRTQAVLGVTQLFGPRLGASQTALGGEFGWLHVHNFPDKNETRIQAPAVAALQFSPQDAFADADSWGYRLASSFTYNNVFGAFTLTPRVIWSHDVSGNSPVGVPFQEGRKSLSVGLGANYLNTITADLSYTTFWGLPRFNTINDRDFINFNIRYSF